MSFKIFLIAATLPISTSAPAVELLTENNFNDEYQKGIVFIGVFSGGL